MVRCCFQFGARAMGATLMMRPMPGQGSFPLVSPAPDAALFDETVLTPVLFCTLTGLIPSRICTLTGLRPSTSHRDRAHTSPHLYLDWARISDTCTVT